MMHKRILLSKQGNLKRLHICNTKYVTFWKRQKYGNNEKITDSQGWGVGTDEQSKPRGSLGQ
jgi:hypothetical protein